MHHSDEITLEDLVKFDVSTRDKIAKRESLKIWDAINQLGSQVTNMPDEAGLARIKTLIGPEIDERIESELEVFNTKLSKQMNAFFADKIKVVKEKMESQVATLEAQEEKLSRIEDNANQTRTTMQR